MKTLLDIAEAKVRALTIENKKLKQEQVFREQGTAVVTTHDGVIVMMLMVMVMAGDNHGDGDGHGAVDWSFRYLIDGDNVG